MKPLIMQDAVASCVYRLTRTLQIATILHTIAQFCDVGDGDIHVAPALVLLSIHTVRCDYVSIFHRMHRTERVERENNTSM